MSVERAPNRICKYSKCNLGRDGNGAPCRKKYWACDGSLKYGGWRSMACCEDHYIKYMQEIFESRNLTEVDVQPVEPSGDEQVCAISAEENAIETYTEPSTARRSKKSK